MSKYARGGANYRKAQSRRLSIESLEPRLALTWAGIPPAVIGIPASPVAVALNSQADASGNASIASTEVDYYSFTATSSGTYTIFASTPSSGLDTVLGLFSSSGQRLAYNDDIAYPTNTDSRMSVNLTAGTRYYIGITNYATSSRGGYTWTIDGPSVVLTDDSYENNDSLSTAYDLGTLSSARTINSLVMADSQDWYRFTTVRPVAVPTRFPLASKTLKETYSCALYNSSGTLLGTSQGTGNSESISLSGLAAGTYYVNVYGNSGVTNPSYSLSISPPAAVDDAHFARHNFSRRGLLRRQQRVESQFD